MPALTHQRTDGYKPFLFIFCLFALAWITVLLFAGGMTTSIQAGMAFLDWPLSNGSINPDGWLTESDKMAEHSHRLLGMKIGLLSIGLLIWTYLRESRNWVRTLARTLVLVVILQGVLGGSRVRFDQLNIMSDNNILAQSFAVMHACGAMVVLGILVALTLANTRRWIEGSAGLGASLPIGVKRWGVAATVTIFLQILIGAIMRHAGAGLAIATFPLASPDSLLPAYWNFGVSIHFAHRVGAIIVTVVLLMFLGKVWGSPAAKRALGYGALLIALILGLQIFLGALTIWTVKNPYAATLHQLVGAFLLASTWGLTFLAHHSGRATNSPTPTSAHTNTLSQPNTDTKDIASDSSEGAFSLRSRVNGYYELTKPRLSFMSVVTAVIGYLSADPTRDFGVLASLLIGTSLAAGGAAVLNQWLEREADAQMVRTKDRPIPSGQIAPYNALMFGAGLSIFGTYLLYAGANPLAGLLTAATVASYVLLYTPLKRLTTWNTLVGAIPGALPPLIGWAAAENGISTLGWILFAILFLWQMPHFFAIAWTYRKDYQKGGFIMLSNSDENGTIVARQAFAFAIALVISTLLPTLLGYASWGYGAVAIIAGCYILRPAWGFLKAEVRDTAARRLFIASIFYLPALLIPLVLDLWLI